MTYRPGFLLKITTWENDADNYRTVDYQSTISDHIEFMIDVCMMFKSKNWGGKYGNSDIGEESTKYRQGDAELVKDLMALVEKYHSKGKLVPEEFDYTAFDTDSVDCHEDWLRDACYELIGSWCDGEYWRVFESYTVLFIPGEIEDVTSHFKKD